MSWQQQLANICHDLNELRRAIASEYHNAGGERANEYLSEAKTLIETAYDVLRREDRWAKTKKEVRSQSRERLNAVCPSRRCIFGYRPAGLPDAVALVPRGASVDGAAATLAG